MAANKKDLGNYDKIIKNYFIKYKNHPNKLNKASLNLELGITRSDIYHWRHGRDNKKPKKWQNDFIEAYDKACSKIVTKHLSKVLKLPQYQWLYLRSCHREEFDDLQENKNIETNNNNIVINLPTVREITPNENNNE